MNPPSAIQGAMSRDRKPFTYTPGGLDLSEIKSERMAKRLMRNAMNQGVPELPTQSIQSPPMPSTPIAVPNFNCLPVQVFPTFSLPANPKSLLRTRSTPDSQKDQTLHKVPQSQTINSVKPSGIEQLRETLNNNTQVNNNCRPASMFEYNMAPTNIKNLPRTNYGSDAYTPQILPEISYEAEYLQALPRNNSRPDNEGVAASLGTEKDIKLTTSEFEPVDFAIKSQRDNNNVSEPFVTKPVEDNVATDDNEQKEVKVVKKQVKKEKKVENQNGDQNGDTNIEAEMTVKLPSKKSQAKTETKVEVVKKVLPDGSVEEIKTTTTRTTIDGRTEIATKTETTIIPKEEEEVEEVEEEEEEENAEVVVQEVEENGKEEIVEVPKKVVVKKAVVQETSAAKENDKKDSIIKREEKSETTTTKKVVVVQKSRKEELDVEEEKDDEEIEEAEPVVIKKPTVKPVIQAEPEAEDDDEEEEEIVEEKKEELDKHEQKVETVEFKKQEVEFEVKKQEVDEDEEEEEEEVEEIEKKVVKTEPPKSEVPSKPDQEEEEDEEEFEEAEEHEKKPDPQIKKEVQPVKESKEQKEEDDESEYTDEEIESEKEEVLKQAPAPDTPQKEPEKESKPEENQAQPPPTQEPKVPLREPSIPLDKVEDVEIKPIGPAHETISKSRTESTEIITNANEKPAGTLSTQTEYNRIENIVTVNRTTKTLDHSYEQLTQQGIPTVKTYFAPERERVSTSPQPSRPYQPVYPSQPQPERRHSLLLERLSTERQMPTSDVYQNYEQQRQLSQEPQSEVINVSNVKPSTITNQQWYQQTRKDNIIYNNVASTGPSVPSQQWSQPQVQPQPQSQFQMPYTENTSQDTSRISSNTYQQNSYPSYTPAPANWGSTLPSSNTPSSQYSLLNKDSTETYQKSTQQFSTSYVPPPWEQDASYVAPPLPTQNYYQSPPSANTFSPSTKPGWKSAPGKFSKPVTTSYVPPAPNQSFVKTVNTAAEPPRLPGRKTYYSEYERRYITVPESTYIPSETKYQPQPDPSPQYYYDNNEPTETVEHQWRKELREFTEKTSQPMQQTSEPTSVKPPWEEDVKYGKVPTVTYTPTPSWSQTLRPQSWRERSFESEYIGSQEWSKTNTLGRGRPLSTYSNVEPTIPERPRGVSVDRYNPNNYQSPITSEHGPVQTHTLTPNPHAKGYHNPNVPAYHTRASVEPRDQSTSIPQPRNWGESRASPIQSRSFKYLQWITGTED